MKSVISEIGSTNFARIRIGIGTPKNKSDLINYVIGKVPQSDIELLDNGVTKAKDAVITIIKEGIDKAMNKFNIKGD